MPESTTQARTLRAAAIVIALAAATVATFFLAVNDPATAFWALTTAVYEVAQGLLIFVSAGGWGALVLTRLMPPAAPQGLRAMTYCALGLWMLSSAVLAAGSLMHGALTPYVWWPVIAVGAVLALWHAWPSVKNWKFPRRLPLASLVWLLVAVAVGLWLAGVMRPPGFIGCLPGDAYDVQEYHLQLPRQYFDAGQIIPMHACFSYYPLGTEMLFLLAMSLRGGAYEGMYLATILHSLQGVVAVAAVFLALRSSDRPRALFIAILLATAPGVVYLSWVAKTELAQVMYLTLALLWLRHWLAEHSWRQALCIGLMLGGACATKYTAVGIVALPVLAVMAVAAVRRWRRLPQTALAGAMVIILLSPWLARNLVTVGNPVFPLAAGTLGKAYWSDEQVKRWADGTGPKKLPPVPVPAGWRAGPPRSFLDMLQDSLVTKPFLSAPLIAMAIAAGVLTIVRYRRERGWELAVFGVLALQFTIWATLSHELPWRFIMPAVAPMALLAGNLLTTLGRGMAPLSLEGRGCPGGPGLPRRRPGEPGEGDNPSGPMFRWALAAVVFLTVATWNLACVWDVFKTDTNMQAVGPIGPISGNDIARGAHPYKLAAGLPKGSRIMLIGEAKAFYFPQGTICALVFDPHPLEQLIDQGLSARQILDSLKAMGVTHLWVDWGEIKRLSDTYGFPAPLSFNAFETPINHRSLPTLLNELETLGARPTNIPKPPITIYALP